MATGTPAPLTLAELLDIDDNRDHLDALRGQYATIPPVLFVGAGVSIPCGMPGWQRFLLDEARKLDAEPAMMARLTSGEFEEAASDLEALLGAMAFEDRLKRAFGDGKLDAGTLQGPVLHLPGVARGPVFTTNFDHVLERVFHKAGRGFEHKVWGAKAGMVGRALHEDEAYLIKVHGDILDDTDRVLTLKQYEEHYGSKLVAKVALDKRLPGILEQAFTSRSMLFVGCSLEGDRTLQLLRRVATLRLATPSHYAIVERPAVTAAVNARRLFLSTHRIRPLWFPKGRYDAIDVFLQEIAGFP